ncbi:MAG: hypothetical protein ABI707_09585 [Ferruginibacter sp.]
MPTVAFSLIIVFFVVFLFIGFTYINNRQKKKTTAMLLSQLSKTGARNNFSFSSHELLNDSILGLDAMRLKLLILQQSYGDSYEWNIIDLEMVKNCSVKKIYKPFLEGNSREKKIENYLDKIVLHFEFTDNRESREVNFYRHITNSIFEMRELEQKAKKWESLLLQMKGNKLKLRA